MRVRYPLSKLLTCVCIAVWQAGCFAWPDENLVSVTDCQVGAATDSVSSSTSGPAPSDSDDSSQLGYWWLDAGAASEEAIVCDTDLNASDPSYTDPNVRRLVAIGDLHGALDATRLILKATDLIDDEDHWVGGDTILVQVGDQMDRKDFDRECIDLLEQLKLEAPWSGGAVYSLLGNHEHMNADLNFNYVSDASAATFEKLKYNPLDPELREILDNQRGRAAAFRPGGPYAVILAKRPVIMILNDTVFSHAGVFLKYAEMGIDQINRDAEAWLLGHGKRPDYLNDESDSPIWQRNYGAPDPESVDCDSVAEALEMLGAKRMVVGHTIQPQGVNSACDGLVYRVDVGMYQGVQIGALIMEGDVMTPLTIQR